MVIEFLMSELDGIERKLRRRLGAVDMESVQSPDLDGDRQTLEYHAIQVKVMWGLMRATGGEIEAVFERYACGSGRGGQRELDRGQYGDDVSRNEEEIEVVVELSKRWDIWRTQYQAECLADLECTEESSAWAVP
jgi:hypothetical protein